MVVYNPLFDDIDCNVEVKFVKSDKYSFEWDWIDIDSDLDKILAGY